MSNSKYIVYDYCGNTLSVGDCVRLKNTEHSYHFKHRTFATILDIPYENSIVFEQVKGTWDPYDFELIDKQDKVVDEKIPSKFLLRLSSQTKQDSNNTFDTEEEAVAYANKHIGPLYEKAYLYNLSAVIERTVVVKRVDKSSMDLPEIS